MGMLDRWNLGAKALGVMRWAADVARSIDPEAALRLAWKVIEIERERRGQPGAMKLSELLQWFTEQYPNAARRACILDDASVVIAYVKAIVDLLNAVGVFAKGAK